MNTRDISEFAQGNFPEEHCYVKHNFSLEPFTWDDLINETTLAEVGNICSIMPIGEDGYAIWDPKSQPIADIISVFHQFKPRLSCRGHLFLSSSPQSKSFPLHKDAGRQNFVFQLIGETPWRVANDKFTLKAGEMIYIPDGVPHYARPNQLRASITVVFEDKDLVR
jgi:mannose-6-phosphate isomerase-like protein (cupin superfamily)